MSSSEVHASVLNKDAARLRRALAAGGDANERARPLQTTPLHVAARYGVVACIVVLLDHGAAVNAQSHFGSTPLYDACDYKQEAAARLLLARGANANIHGDQGRTPFHVAIKRGLVDLAREMLDAGAADPSVASRGNNHDTKSFVKRSSAAKKEREELLALLPQYVSLESAVAARNPRAVEAVVKRAFASNDMGVAVVTYLNAEPHHNGLGEYRARLLMASIQINRPDLFQRVLTAGVDANTKPIRALLEQTRFEGEQVQTTALHLAAFYGHTQFIEFLVNECGLDPEIRDAMDRRPIQLVTDAKDPANSVRSLLTQLTRQRRFRRFTQQVLSCTNRDDELLDPRNAATMLPQLEQLTETLSSVRDVRVVFNLGVVTFSQDPTRFKQLLTRAFTQLLADKLVVDDREALVFKLVLRECERRGVLSELEVEHWDLQLVKVNMESAPWVKALQQNLQQATCRLETVAMEAQTLRHQYDQLTKAIATARSSGVFGRVIARLRGLLQLLSVVLSIAGVDGSEAIDTIVDLSDPLSVLAATYKVTVGEQLAAYMEDPTASAPLEVRPEVASVLERAGIDATDLASTLREVVLLERDYTEQTNGENEKVTEETKPTSVEIPEIRKTKQSETSSVDEPESDLELFPFHYAVKHSGGDLQAFLNVVEFIEEDPSESTRHADAIVEIPQAAPSTKAPIRVRATPAVLASRLGYVEIVRYFLDASDYVATAEKKYVTMQRAHTIRQRMACMAHAA